MNLNVKIRGVKCIKDHTFELPLEKGIYAITGKNGTGKSTLAACASISFFHYPKKAYLGSTGEDALIECVLDGKTISYERKKDSDEWHLAKNEHLSITGFFEGSLLYGNRFRDLRYENIFRIENIDKKLLVEASPFVRENLGGILHNNKSFYEHIFLYDKTKDEENKRHKFKGNVFYYERFGSFVNQFQMSTGEYLLVHLLYTLEEQLQRIHRKDYFVIFLDEVELALHPSALRQLLGLLKKIAQDNNIAIYFSTHSIEIISEINPENILYIERYADDSVDLLRPCYPAFATRTLYNFSGYDFIILVEDELAKGIIEELLKRQQLRNNKLIYVLPCGGYNQVIDMAAEAVSTNMLGQNCNIYIVLDGDVEQKANDYIQSKGYKINPSRLEFLPIESLEKYLKKELVDTVNHRLFRLLDSQLFEQVGLQRIMEEYSAYKAEQYKIKKSKYPDATDEDILVHIDAAGKHLYDLIEAHSQSPNRGRDYIIRLVIEFLFNEKDTKLDALEKYLNKQFKS